MLIEEGLSRAASFAWRRRRSEVSDADAGSAVDHYSLLMQDAKEEEEMSSRRAAKEQKHKRQRAEAQRAGKGRRHPLQQHVDGADDSENLEKLEAGKAQ